MVGDRLDQKIDYGQPVSTVFTNIVVRLLLERGDLFWLGKTGQSRLNQKTEGLPSWVPNWTLSVGENSQYEDPYRGPLCVWCFYQQVMLYFKFTDQSNVVIKHGTKRVPDALPSILALQCCLVRLVERVHTNTAALSSVPDGHPSTRGWKQFGVINTLGFRQAFVEGGIGLSLIVPASTRPGDYFCTIEEGVGPRYYGRGLILRETHPIKDEDLIRMVPKFYEKSHVTSKARVLHATLVGKCFYRNAGRGPANSTEGDTIVLIQ
jgi:hypothetical protein